MIKVLVLCIKLENSKKIINNIIRKISNLQLIGIANTYYEAKEILMETEADIIITTNQQIIEFLKNEFITYNPGIIIIDNIVRIKNNYKKVLLINNENDFETMTNKIKFFLRNSIEYTQKEKVSNILHNIGFDYNLSGTVYLQDSILYAHSYKGSYSFEKLKRDIYNQVAIYNNTTSDRVKWSIERAIKYLYKKKDPNTYIYIEKVFKIKFPEKIKAKQLISTIANSLDFIDY